MPLKQYLAESYSTILARKIFKYFQISDLTFSLEKREKTTRKEPVRSKTHRRKEIIKFSTEISDIGKKKRLKKSKASPLGRLIYVINNPY